MDGFHVFLKNAEIPHCVPNLLAPDTKICRAALGPKEAYRESKVTVNSAPNGALKGNLRLHSVFFYNHFGNALKLLLSTIYVEMYVMNLFFMVVGGRFMGKHGVAGFYCPASDVPERGGEEQSCLGDSEIKDFRGWLKE
ncbi:hypothetical protein AVEN_182965-1 [Araneus ventricosus]|uniref:Uncharacterized protein n=1 Tax=Araneus ventricosus TaxID=182803 RepID=A0A4Y2U7E6_ARAVE|nr:hypothetical protein AVEN_5636-1 [Araneus ventricosus]GBO16129.1 hypothetical protein AVEN_182965-1 [Araneus ventricosus]